MSILERLYHFQKNKRSGFSLIKELLALCESIISPAALGAALKLQEPDKRGDAVKITRGIVYEDFVLMVALVLVH